MTSARETQYLAVLYEGNLGCINIPSAMETQKRPDQNEGFCRISMLSTKEAQPTTESAT